MFKNVSLNQLYVLSLLMTQDRYGYEIIKLLKKDADVSIALGSLYNILGKFENEGYVEAYWGEQTADRGGNRRRYYKITGAGETFFYELQTKINGFWGNLSLT